MRVCSRTIYDTLVRAKGKTSVGPRTSLFGNTNVGWTSKASIEVPGKMASDQGLAFTGMEVRATFSESWVKDFVEQRLYASLFIGDLSTRDSPQRVKLNQRLDFEIAPVLPFRQHYYGCLEWFDIEPGDLDRFNAWEGEKSIALYLFGIDLPVLFPEDSKVLLPFPYYWPKRLPSETLPIEVVNMGAYPAPEDVGKTCWRVQLGNYSGPVMKSAPEAVLAFDYAWLSDR